MTAGLRQFAERVDQLPVGGKFPNDIVGPPHGSAEAAQRPGVEGKFAGLFHQQREVPSRVLGDEMMQERRFSRAEKSGDKRDGQRAGHARP